MLRETLGLLLLIAMTGCSSGPQSTAYTATDMDIVVNDMREQLSASAFLTGRDQRSEQIVLVPLKMENFSNDRLSRVDQWTAISRVFFEPTLVSLLQSNNIVLVLPADGQRVVGMIRGGGGQESDSDLNSDPYQLSESSALTPTHAVNARFESITRAASQKNGELSNIRKDLFIVSYTIVDLQTRETVWAGSNEFTRLARGVLAN